MLIRNASRLKALPPPEDIQSLIQDLHAEEFRAWVDRISVPRHYLMNPQANLDTRTWLAETFHEWGYEVRLQGRYGNVVATPLELTGPAILVGAHYDSVPQTPGADDNGSAIAAMLGCSRICAQWKDLPVVFVAFNREEDGLLGSEDWVTASLPQSRFTVEKGHILEMVGYASHEPGSQQVPPGLPIKLPDRGTSLAFSRTAPGPRSWRNVCAASARIVLRCQRMVWRCCWAWRNSFRCSIAVITHRFGRRVSPV